MAAAASGSDVASISGSTRRGPRPLPTQFRTTPSLQYAAIAASSSADSLSTTTTPVINTAASQYPQLAALAVDTSVPQSSGPPSRPIVTPDYRDYVTYTPAQTATAPGTAPPSRDPARSYTGSNSSLAAAGSQSMPGSAIPPSSRGYSTTATPAQSIHSYQTFDTPIYSTISSQMASLNVSGAPSANAQSTGNTPVWSPDPRVLQSSDDRRAMTMVDAQQIRDEFNRRKAAAAAAQGQPDRPQSEMLLSATRRAESDQDINRRLQDQKSMTLQYSSMNSLQYSSVQATPISSNSRIAPDGSIIPPRVSSRNMDRTPNSETGRPSGGRPLSAEQLGLSGQQQIQQQIQQQQHLQQQQQQYQQQQAPPFLTERSGSAQSFSSVENIAVPETDLVRRPTFAPPKPRPPRIITQMNAQQTYEPEPAYQRQAPPPRTVSAMPPPPQPQQQPQQYQQQPQQELLHRPPPGATAVVAAQAQAEASSSNAPAVKGQRLEWKQTLDLYRANAKKTDNPKIQLEFAKFLVETAQALPHDTPAERQERDQLLDEGFRWLKKLATSSYPEAQYFLGTQYAQDGEYDKGFALWLQASKHNHPGSCYEAGRCYELGLGTKKDSRRAQQFYVKSASAGYVPAMYRLGVAALHGECGFRKDPKEAVKWLKRGSAAGDAQSSYTLSGIYENGAAPSIYADEAYAKSLLEEAAEKGWAPAQAKLAVCYEYGKLTCEVSPMQAVRWAKQAAELGHPEAQFSLAGWYLTGAEGVIPQSNRDALWWALKAAEQGLPKAEYAVGYFYEVGIGAPPEISLATQWYQTAAAHGEKRAIQRLSGQNPAPLLRTDTVTQAVKAVRKQNDSDCSLM